MSTDSQLVEVHMIGVPLDLWQQARSWFDGLLREFDVLAADADESTPRELLAFVGEVRESFSGFTSDPNAQMEEAHRRGEESLDVTLRLPPEAAPAARQLWEQIQRAEDYCRRGDLLTLTPDDQLRGFVHWYLMEAAGQLEGASPTPWRESGQPPTR